MRHAVAYVHAYVGMGRNAGAETTLHDILKFLVKNGWQATVLVATPYPGQAEYYIDGVKVIPQSNKRDILDLVNKASVLISHLDCSERTAFIARKFHCPMVHLVHNDMWETHSYLGCGCDLAIFNTQWVSDKFTGYEGLSIVVHPPVDPSVYATKTSAKDRKYVTLVNMWDQKGSAVFYDIAMSMPDVQFLGVLGGYGVQDIRAGFPNVTIHDHVSDMRDVYSESRIIIMPSRYESYGRIAVEAAASGIPALVNDTPGLREALGGSAIVCTSPDDYAREIVRLANGRSYAAASKRSLARSKVLDVQSHEELERLLVTINGVADTGSLIRGW